ncbi:MAG: phosphoglycerate dehydrogenase [Deltaproteobacteria bacterium]|nr:phosphoglycerate dehydrogenase [Deltaproteobacteria bacterium]
MYRVLVSDTLATEGIDILKNTPSIEVDVKTGLPPAELAEIIGNYDGLVIRSATKVSAAIIERAARLKVIGRAGSGLDNVDAEAASKRGIVLMNTPGGNTITTAEHAVAMMLSLARQIPQATSSMKIGKWEKKKFMGAEVYNKVLGVIGIGRIGSIVASRAQGLKMHVIAYDPFITAEAAEKMEIGLAGSLDELLEKADFITLHSPLTNETKEIINKSNIAKMKKGVFIINCARGGLVNEQDLYEGLASKKVAGAALDVFQEEPTTNTALLALENVIATPHLGASTDEAQRNVAVAIAEQLVDYFVRGEIRNAVNMPSVSAEMISLIKPYLALAEKLGAFQSQLVAGAVEEAVIEFSGEILEYDITPVTIAVIKGLLSPILHDSVNYVNAPIIARERGIKVIESKSSERKDYRSMIGLTIRTNKEESFAAGAVFGREEYRIVRVNKFSLDVVPEGHLIVIYNQDKPGVIGNIGVTMGNHGINIARLHLGREQVDGIALVVLSTDSSLSDTVVAKLRELPHVISTTTIDM